MASSPITSWQIDGETKETMTNFIFLGCKINADGDCSHEIKRFLLPGRKAMINVDNVLKIRHYFANKGLYSQSYGFSSSHVWMWELGYKEGWAPKNWCFWTVVLEKTLESPLDSVELKPVNLKGNQPWIFIGRTDAEDEVLILWPSDAESRHTGKESDGGKDWEWEGEATEDEMVGWHHRLSGHEYEQAPGDGGGQESLTSCSPWVWKELDMT